MRNGMGSWVFIGGFVGFMIVWAIVNSTSLRWDPYPFILLNLFLSMLAGLQGAILLIAAKRQDAIAAALARHDYETNVAAKEEIERLMDINREQLDLIERLCAAQGLAARSAEETGRHSGIDSGDAGPAAPTRPVSEDNGS
jgi:uncharacterized membrane protein